jgi:hypothetical protein
MGTESFFPGVKRPAVALTTHPLLAPRLCVGRAIPHLPSDPPCHVIGWPIPLNFRHPNGRFPDGRQVQASYIFCVGLRLFHWCKYLYSRDSVWILLISCIILWFKTRIYPNIYQLSLRSIVMLLPSTSVYVSQVVLRGKKYEPPYYAVFSILLLYCLSGAQVHPSAPESISLTYEETPTKLCTPKNNG